jgi:hypothetical protein
MRNLLNFLSRFAKTRCKAGWFRSISISHGAHWTAKNFIISAIVTCTLKGCSSSNNNLLQLQDLLYNIWVLLTSIWTFSLLTYLNTSKSSKAGESQPRAPGQNDDWWTRTPCPSQLSRWLFLITSNERIASELLAKNRGITVNDVQLTVFAEKTIEKSFISHLVHFTIDDDDQRIVCK